MSGNYRERSPRVIGRVGRRKPRGAALKGKGPEGTIKPLVPYQWRKGQSGNPGGKPKTPLEVIKLAREHTIEAVHVLVELMLDPDVKPRDRAYAAALILERGLGKAPQLVRIEGDEETSVGARRVAQARSVVNDAERVTQIIKILSAAGALEMVAGKDFEHVVEAPVEEAEVVAQ